MDATYEYKEKAQHLTKQSGVFQGPSGKETYYNLNMNGVVSNAQAQGIQGQNRLGQLLMEVREKIKEERGLK